MRTSMKHIRVALIFLPFLVLASGCASMRSTSSFENGATLENTKRHTMMITTENISNRKYKEIGVLKVTVKKLTVFNADPTNEDANVRLEEEAKKVGADAVIKVSYKGGPTWDSWGAVKAEGVAIKFTDNK